MSGHAAFEPTIYRAGLALTPGGVDAVVFGLPGCQCSAPDEAAVRELLPVVIAEHIAWLDQHGDVTRNAFPFEVEVVEDVDVTLLAGIANGHFCFRADLVPATRDDVETALRRMSYARTDLLRSVRHLPDDVLDWEPRAGSVLPDQWVPEVRTIRGILRHIAEGDGYRIESIGATPGPVASMPTDIFQMRELAVRHLKSLSDAALAREFRNPQPDQGDAFEQWSVRKALRRIIAHERFHTKEIEQRLAWLLIGAPDLSIATVGSRP